MKAKAKQITYLCSTAKHSCNAAQHEFYAGDCNAVAQRLVTGAVRCAGDIRTVIRKPLQPFALQRGQAADNKAVCRSSVVFLIRLAYKIGGVFMLPCALCAGNILLHELIDTLSIEYCVMVGGGQGIGNIRLPAETVPTVLRLVSGSCETSGTLFPPVP